MRRTRTPPPAALSARLLRRALWLAGLAAAVWVRASPPADRPVPAGAAVRQWSAATCGPASAATMLNLYGLRWTRAQLERECGTGSRGATLFGLRECLRRHGLAADGFHVPEPRGLLRLPRPFIAYLGAPQAVGRAGGAPIGARSSTPSGHFVVVAGRSGTGFRILDPAGVSWTCTQDRLFRLGGGWALVAQRPAAGMVRSWVEQLRGGWRW